VQPQSHADERRERDEILARLRGEADRLQARPDALYTDKLDGTITSDYHDRMAAVWREERTRCLNEGNRPYSAEEALIDDGIALNTRSNPPAMRLHLARTRFCESATPEMPSYFGLFSIDRFG
jgi:hypothetical protein